MQSQWERRRILIWGKTRPEISKAYREIVCTGGVFADTKRLVRLYPIPLRYMEDERNFKKYQWIEADVAKSTSDYRPESYKIRTDNMKSCEVIDTENGDWDARAEWILREHNIFPSVEGLKRKQSEDHTSLGLVKPLEVSDIREEKYSKKEREEFWDRYHSAVQQMELPLDQETGREIKPIPPPDYRFKVRFRCNDPDCKGHEFSVLDWEPDALYFNLIRQQNLARNVAASKVVGKLRDICGPDKDLYFFLGNISNHQETFTIVGFWWPKMKSVRAKQLSLL